VDHEDLNVGNLLETKLQRRPDTFIRQGGRVQNSVHWLVPTVVAVVSLLIALRSRRWFRFLSVEKPDKDRLKD
jgi:hypothetical protein